MKTRGFTLIEVMVALFVIALGVGALLTTLVSAADMVGYLREKSLAQWIALNRVSELRLSNTRPEPGLTSDTIEYAGGNWRREQQVSDAGVDGLLRIDVRVSRVLEPATAGARESGADEENSTLGRAVGFIGTAIARPSGLNPDWNPRPPAGGGPGGDDSGGDDAGGPGGPGGPGDPGGPGGPGGPADSGGPGASGGEAGGDP